MDLISLYGDPHEIIKEQTTSLENASKVTNTTVGL